MLDAAIQVRADTIVVPKIGLEPISASNKFEFCFNVFTFYKGPMPKFFSPVLMTFLLSVGGGGGPHAHTVYSTLL